MNKYINLFFIFFISNFVFSQVTDLFSSQISDFTTTSKNQYTVVESQQTSSFTTQVGAPQLPVLPEIMRYHLAVLFLMLLLQIVAKR